MSNKVAISQDEKKLVNDLFWHSFLLEASYNYERQQALGFAVGMAPAIEKFYKTKEEKAEAYQRHMAIYNTTPHVSGMISGVSAALEKEASLNPKFDRSSINNVKVGLMGPLAGIGDSFFWGTFRIIAAGIAISMAQQGSVIAPLVFLVLFNVPHIAVRYYGTKFGYMFGTELVTNMKSSGILQTISKAATIVGLMVVGGMSASMVRLSTSYKFMLNEVEFPLQNYIDQIFPLLLPLLYTLSMLWLLKKGYKSSTILFLTIGVALLGTFAGLF